MTAPGIDHCANPRCVETAEALDTATAELTRARDDAARRRRDEAEHRRRVEASLRRKFEDDRGVRGGLFVRRWVSAAQTPVWSLIDRVRSLPARPRAGDLEQLRDLAGHTQHLIRQHTADLDVDEFYRASRAEVRRIRDYVAGHAVELHAVHGGTPDGRDGVGCRCIGCELMVGLDDVAPATGEQS